MTIRFERRFCSELWAYFGAALILNAAYNELGSYGAGVSAAKFGP